MLTIAHGAEAVLSFLVTHWPAIGKFVCNPVIRLSNGQALREALYPMVDGIAFPDAFVAGRAGEGDTKARYRTGTLLVSLFIARRSPHDAFNVFDALNVQGIHLPATQLLSLTRALLRSRARELAIQVFENLSRTQSPPSSRTILFTYHSTGLKLYATLGNVERAAYFFGRLEEHGWVNKPRIAQMLHAYAMGSDVNGAIELFERYFGRDGSLTAEVYHYTEVILAHERTNKVQGIRHWLERMVQAGIEPDRAVYSIMARHFVNQRELKSVAVLLDQMIDRGFKLPREVFTTVIHALGQRRDPRAAEALYTRALEIGVKPDRMMNAALMDAHVEAGSWIGALRVFDYMMNQSSHQDRPQAHEFNTLIKVYVLSGAPFSGVRNILRRMEGLGIKPTLHTFSLALQSAADHHYMDVALGLYRRLEELARDDTSGFEVSVYARTIMISGYLRAGRSSKARRMYEEMLALGIKPTTPTYNAIIHRLARPTSWGGLTHSRRYLDDVMSMEDKSWYEETRSPARELATVHAPVMNRLAREGRAQEAQELYDTVVKAGGAHELGIAAIQLNAYRNAQDLAGARRIWERSLALAVRESETGTLLHGAQLDADAPRPRLRPTGYLRALLSIYMDLLSRLGHHSEVAKVWATVQETGAGFDAHNWNHLVVVLIRAGEVFRAFSVVERVLLPTQARARAIIRGTSGEEYKPPLDSPLTFARDAAAVEPDPLEAAEAANRPDSLTGLGRFFSALAARRIARNHPHLLPKVPDQVQPGVFEHPLEVLRRIAPGFNEWRVHSGVRRVLTAVLTHISQGKVVLPLQGEVDESPDFEPPDPRELLLAIERECPVTVSQLQFMMRRRRRVEGKRYRRSRRTRF
ncbi:hypothetical protein K488DRAFT_48766 [Vararia minispora EC-137]|uniref:Uncharacterized protein n=1 Tax=Vararia minispora EC-137 TaxID=1314806 RepID=A0ACB8QMG9_9AGAM|nr:hypothetical protein K488DRAFT_48766 [Vararia minispora EC-137]